LYLSPAWRVRVMRQTEEEDAVLLVALSDFLFFQQHRHWMHCNSPLLREAAKDFLRFLWRRRCYSSLLIDLYCTEASIEQYGQLESEETPPRREEGT